MDNDLPEVTEDSLKQFIQDYPQFCFSLRYWLIQRAEAGDVSALLHFTKLGEIRLTEAGGIIDGRKAKKIKGFHVDFPKGGNA